MTLHEVSMMEQPEENCLAVFIFHSFGEAVQFIKMASESEAMGCLSFDYRRSEV